MQHQLAVAGLAAPSLAPTEPAQENDAAALAPSGQPYIDRPRGHPTLGRFAQPGLQLAPVLLGDEADQLLADQRLKRRAEQVAERAVRLFEPAQPVDQRDPDRRVGEKALEALARAAQLRFPLALRSQVAHDRAGAQFGAVADRTLAQPRLQRATGAALECHLAALTAI